MVPAGHPIDGGSGLRDDEASEASDANEVEANEGVGLANAGRQTRDAPMARTEADSAGRCRMVVKVVGPEALAVLHVRLVHLDDRGGMY